MRPEMTADQAESSEVASDGSCLQEREGHSSHKPLERLPTAPSLCHEFDWLVLLYLRLQCCDSSEERLRSQAPPSQILEGGAWERWAQETCNEAHTHCTPVVQHSGPCTSLVRAQGEVVTQV